MGRDFLMVTCCYECLVPCRVSYYRAPGGLGRFTSVKQAASFLHSSASQSLERVDDTD